MPRTPMTAEQVAACLHLSIREVIRMAERGILPAHKVKDRWRFRCGDVWNWIEENLQTLPARRSKDSFPQLRGDLVLTPILRIEAIRVDLVAKTRASIIREMVHLALQADPTLDEVGLLNAVQEREDRGSTALQDGVAILHPIRPIYAEEPVVAAARTFGGVAFGERGGGITDLFFLVASPDHARHLLILGRVSRLLVDPRCRQMLRDAADCDEFHNLLLEAERKLCEES